MPKTFISWIHPAVPPYVNLYWITMQPSPWSMKSCTCRLHFTIGRITISMRVFLYSPPLPAPCKWGPVRSEAHHVSQDDDHPHAPSPSTFPPVYKLHMTPGYSSVPDTCILVYTPLYNFCVQTSIIAQHMHYNSQRCWFPLCQPCWLIFSDVKGLEAMVTACASWLQVPGQQMVYMVTTKRPT